LAPPQIPCGAKLVSTKGPSTLNEQAECVAAVRPGATKRVGTIAKATMSATAFLFSKPVFCFMLKVPPLPEVRVVGRSYESEIKNHRGLGFFGPT
jgi:hypothetical protein